MTLIADSRKKRGRPATGIGSSIGLRLYPALDRALDTWIAQQPDPKPSRPEVIRLALREWLVGVGLLTPRDKPEP